MTRKRTRFLPSFFGIYPNIDTPTDSLATGPLKSLYRKLLPEKKKQPRYECNYCANIKKASDFISRAALPYHCQYHLGTSDKRVCRTCLESWLSAQLDCKTLLEISCPECDRPWDPEEVRYLIAKGDQKKFRVLEEMAKERVLIPEEVPERGTTDFLLNRGTRFCPWCRWPFIKEGGCDAMQCIKCRKCFNIEYALILEDDEGNRASPVPDEVEDEIY